MNTVMLDTRNRDLTKRKLQIELYRFPIEAWIATQQMIGSSVPTHMCIQILVI